MAIGVGEREAATKGNIVPPEVFARIVLAISIRIPENELRGIQRKQLKTLIDWIKAAYEAGDSVFMESCKAFAGSDASVSSRYRTLSKHPKKKRHS